MDFRHEWKVQISFCDLLVLRQRLKAVMQPDEYAIEGKYHIRSLYFDTPEDTALLEKTNGVSRREKFRIRYYNLDPSLVHLEKKSKLGGLCNKQTATITAVEAQKIADGDTGWMADSSDPLVRELYAKMQQTRLQPKTIVDYIREPFVYAPGNVRVTLDSDIRTGLHCTDFLNPDCTMVPAGDAPIILEVKWDEFLPDVIRDIIQLGTRRSGAFSKYAQCRIYG